MPCLYFDFDGCLLCLYHILAVRALGAVSPSAILLLHVKIHGININLFYSKCKHGANLSWFLSFALCSIAMVGMIAISQFRAEKGALPEAGDMEQAEAVYGLAKACNEEVGGFTAEGLDDSKVRMEGGLCISAYCTRGIWMAPPHCELN